jgi:YXWGXW repeat-containing protein
MWRWMLRTTGAVIFSSLFLVSPASASTHVYIRFGPPARVVEVVPAPAHRGYVWQDGYHRWNGHRYVWVRGRYVRPPYARAAWVSGRWSHAPRGYYWVPGHWVRR